MPWRHEDDYYHRLAVSAKNTAYDPFKWRSKYLGLLIDTMGTNPLAYRMCKAMYYGLTNLPSSWMVKDRLYRPVNVPIPANVFATVPTEQQLQEYITEGDERLAKSFEKTGLDNKSARNAINHKWLIEEFAWDDIWRTAWAVHYGLDMYNHFGDKIYVEWLGKDNTPENYLESVASEYDEV